MDNDPQYRTGDGSAVRIWKDTAKNNFLSEREGRAIFDEVIYVEVIAPGSKGSTPVFEVERVFAEEMNHPQPLRGIQYDQFKDMIEVFKKNDEIDAKMTGTPLTEWPEISRTMAASLREAAIYSVEALASLPDEKLSVVGPDGRTWRTKAEAYLAAAKDSGYATAIAAENERLKAELDATKSQIADLAAQIEALSKAQAAAPAEPATPPAAPAAKGTKPAAPADII